MKGAVCWPLRPARGSKSSRKERQGPVSDRRDGPQACAPPPSSRTPAPETSAVLQCVPCPALPQDVKAAQDAGGAGLSGWRQPRTGARRAAGSAESPPAQLLTGLLCSEAHGRPRRGPRFSCSLGLCAHVLSLAFHRCFLLPLHALPLCFLPFKYV